MIPAWCTRHRSCLSIYRDAKAEDDQAEDAVRWGGAPHWPSGPDAAVHLPERELVDPEFTAGRPDLCGDMGEEVEVIPPLFLMGDHRCAKAAPADRAATLRDVLWFGLHGFVVLLVFVPFRFHVHGSAHLRGSSQWTVIT